MVIRARAKALALTGCHWRSGLVRRPWRSQAVTGDPGSHWRSQAVTGDPGSCEGPGAHRLSLVIRARAKALALTGCHWRSGLVRKPWHSQAVTGDLGSCEGPSAHKLLLVIWARAKALALTGCHW
ncbi:hypothetical protein NDU88_000207 [Pleurodeles waltl]|uniref:Uncharacterized protein n=1 Tax=Pleurodeles waltl TaxID=8319 RepID=A0AAV7MG83_PLEWA|nr:hypothetical protein NDU88_000207 [Pleurodeles waltl]